MMLWNRLNNFNMICLDDGDYGFGTLRWFFLYNYLIRFFCLWFMSVDNLAAMLPFQRLIWIKYDTIEHKSVLDATKFITVWTVLCDGVKFTLRYVYEQFLILFIKFDGCKPLDIIFWFYCALYGAITWL